MEYLRKEALPPLRNPVLIGAFAGWNDAATVATSAIRFLIRVWSAQMCADIDPEDFFVFSESRPQVQIVVGTQREIVWPITEFYYTQDPNMARDYVLLIGIEPQLKWRTFSQTILQFCKAAGVNMVVTLGGLLADVAHSSTTQLSGSSSDPQMAAKLSRLGVQSSGYQGPTGIVGVMNMACRDAGIPSASIWGSVPHYISSTPNPKVTTAILRRLNALLDLDLDLTDWDMASTKFEAEIAEAVKANPEVAEYVRQLEAQERDNRTPEETSPQPTTELPSGETIVQELEEFLRRRQRENSEDQEES